MRGLWLLFGFVLCVSFAILSWIGVRIYQEMPPIVDQVVTTEGKECVRDRLEGFIQRIVDDEVGSGESE